MPFINQNPRPYTRDNIEALAPNQNGVYGIFNDTHWIYVGKGDIRERMLAHFDGDNPCINNNFPTRWVAEKWTSDPSEREKELILELRPSCNRRVG